jgi:TRAP-type C4-dicarboxylate transport system substrate-binding protein
VTELSGGSIQFEFTGNSRDGDVHAEAKMLEDVREGVVDLAVIGARVFDTVGVDRPSAMMAPLLIDSYELEQAVFEAELPQRLLGSFDDLGVLGVGAIPGPLQKLVGFDRTFLDVADFADAVIATPDSVLGQHTYSALGATPEVWPPGDSFDGFSGIALQWGAILGRHAELTAQGVTSNLNVWARPMIVVVNPDVYASLDPTQQAAFPQAAKASVAEVVASTRAEGAVALGTLCDAGLEVATTTDEQLDEIRELLAPVYDHLAQDPEIAAFLDAVERLKDELGVPPDAADCAHRS